MQVLNLIGVVFECCFIFWSVLLLIAIAVYAAKSVFAKENEEAEVEKSEWEKAVEADEKFMKSMEAKLDLLLKLHGCDVYEDIIERPTYSVYDKFEDVNDKLSVLLCGPLDEETLKELQAEREANKK